MVYELESDLQGWNMKWLVDINAGKNQILLFEYSYSSSAIDGEWRSVFVKKVIF